MLSQQQKELESLRSEAEGMRQEEGRIRQWLARANDATVRDFIPAVYFPRKILFPVTLVRHLTSVTKFRIMCFTSRKLLAEYSFRRRRQHKRSCTKRPSRTAPPSALLYAPKLLQFEIRGKITASRNLLHTFSVCVIRIELSNTRAILSNSLPIGTCIN